METFHLLGWTMSMICQTYGKKYNVIHTNIDEYKDYIRTRIQPLIQASEGHLCILLRSNRKIRAQIAVENVRIVKEADRLYNECDNNKFATLSGGGLLVIFAVLYVQYFLEKREMFGKQEITLEHLQDHKLIIENALVETFTECLFRQAK